MRAEKLMVNSILEPAVKLDRLLTEFQPNRMILHVELVPPEGMTFETPLKEPGKKLNMIANYARTIFDVELRRPLKEGRLKYHGR